MKTRRDKVAPEGLLVPRKESLADLADRLMTLIYGPHAETALLHRLMHQPRASGPGDYVVGDDDEVVALVKLQIISALAAGQIVLAVELDLSSFEEQINNNSDTFKLLNVDEDNKFDAETEWVIAPHFWLEANAAEAISWNDSTLRVPASFIYEGCSAVDITPPYRKTRPLHRYFANLPENILAKTYVANPDVALRRFFKFGPLPSEQQTKEYQSSIANLVKEATAAAWRHLAKTGVGEDFNQRELARYMIEYLKSRNLYDGKNDGPSEGVLVAVAGKVHKQFLMDAAALANQPVYVSSTPKSDVGAAKPNQQSSRKRRAPGRAQKAQRKQ